MSHTPITVAYGDGIGPEIMEATLHILQEAGARISVQTIEVGKNVYEKGHSSGIAPSAWESIRSTKVLLKAPITTPQGGGYKSLNVTMRKTLGLFANVRPCVSYSPFVETHHPRLDMVIVRENTEDLYAGIEHRQTQDVYQCLKLISRPASEQIIRYAFDYAVNNGRKKVTCFSKDNIMKMTDGIFHKVYDEVAKEYPQIEKEHYIIDIGSARIASKPEVFDVIVTSNLYGDIISDIAAEVSGSVGLAGSSNIGKDFAMFEAIHGSAPDIAGQDIANPSGLLQAAVMMLVHIGQHDVATKIHNGWLAALESGMHTADIYSSKISQQRVGTKEFAKIVVKHLGQEPKKLKKVNYQPSATTQRANPVPVLAKKADKQLVGVDVSFEWNKSPKELAEQINAATKSRLKLQILTSRGLKLWPSDEVLDAGCDHCQARFVPEGEKTATLQDIITLLGELTQAKLDFIKLDNLYTFDGALGFTLAQGE